MFKNNEIVEFDKELKMGNDASVALDKKMTGYIQGNHIFINKDDLHLPVYSVYSEETEKSYLVFESDLKAVQNGDKNKIDKSELKTYQKASDQILEMKDELKARKELFDKNNERLTLEIAKLEESQAIRKEKITEKALSEFRQTGEKKLLGGIGIRENKKIAYSEEEAFDWARSHHMCLQLDRKKFEKIAPELVDFITTTKVPSVTFPKVIKLDEEVKDEN